MKANARRVFGSAWLVSVVVVTVSFDKARASHDVSCGDILVEDVRLEADLNCAGAGLIVGANDIRVNLNGHVISGNGTANGIDVAGRSGVSVYGGTIRGFFTGLRAMNSTAIDIKNMRFDGNTDGVDLQSGSMDISIKDNEFAGNSSRGVMMRGGTSEVEVKSNTFDRNRVGVLLFATVAAVVKDNAIASSGLAGIRINFQTGGNLVADNTIVSNPTGIDFILGTAGGSTGNTLADNFLGTNGCGLKGPLSGNTLKNNVFVGNTTDICP